MASNFAFHPTVNEVLPFNANYTFPNQATRQSKRTVKLTPKNNAAIYSSGSTIRFEFPASGYLNPNTTYLAFNCNVKVTSGPAFLYSSTDHPVGFEFQNGIQSIFRRVRVLYGSMVIEDIQDYNVLQRIFTETVLPSGSMFSPNAMYQGIGTSYRYQTNGASNQGYISAPFHENAQRTNYHSSAEPNIASDVGTAVRRYAIPINTGLFQQRNLIPLKFMASQLSVELELADAVDCCIVIASDNASGAIPTGLSVQVGLPELVTELLEFDSNFDQAIFQGMKTGLPIYFQSWHVTTQNVSPNLTVQLNIQESARSVRYALAVLMNEDFRSLRKDTHHFIAGLSAGQGDAEMTSKGGQSHVTSQTAVESYQWRLGGTYYPSQPVACISGTTQNVTNVEGNYADPPVEAYAEVMKVFGNLFADDGTFFGDQRSTNYCQPRKSGTFPANTFISTAFVMAGDFMSDRGDVISGINAEEQNDLQLILKFVGTSGGSTKTAKIITCYDNLIILGQSNNMVHIN